MPWLKEYGGREVSYAVLGLADGYIELRVCHTNIGVTNRLRKLAHDPIEIGRQFGGKEGSTTMAEKHLASVIAEFRPHFEAGRVRVHFVDSPESPPSALRELTLPAGMADEDLWVMATNNPQLLFKTIPAGSLDAIFTSDGFYLSPDIEPIYDRVKNAPHVYVARKLSGDGCYIGKSNQPGGRWKRSHYYHLGDLAQTVLKLRTAPKYEAWIESWFVPNSLLPHGDFHTIRQQEKVIISFAHIQNGMAEETESRLLRIAKGRGVNLLNIVVP